MDEVLEVAFAEADEPTAAAVCEGAFGADAGVGGADGGAEEVALAVSVAVTHVDGAAGAVVERDGDGAGVEFDLVEHIGAEEGQ